MIILMLANERSGTHFLRSALENTGWFEAPGEVCNAEAEHVEKTDLSFFSFKNKFIVQKSALALPTVDHQSALLDAYFSFIDAFRQSQRKKCIIIDIKYAHVHNFNGFWWDFFSSPFLIEHAKARGMPILHLMRENTYHTAFSEIYAQHTGVWRAESVGDVVSSKLSVDVGALRDKAERIRLSTNLFSRWLSDAWSHTVDYAAMTGENRVDTLNAVMKFLELPRQRDFNSGFIKTTPRYETVVENYREIAALME